MPKRVPVAADIDPWLYRFPTTVDGGLWRQPGVNPEIMQQAIGLKLQQVSPITFLRLPKRTFKEPNISEIERRCAWVNSLFDPSFWKRGLGDGRAGNGRGKRAWEGCTDGGGHGACTQSIKHLTSRETFFILARQISLISIFVHSGSSRSLSAI